MAEPKAIGPWPVVRQLGRGGQGTVYLVRSPDRQKQIDDARAFIGKALYHGPVFDVEEQEAVSEAFVAAMDVALRSDRGNELGAGKVYHVPDGPDADRVIGRLKNEFEVLSRVKSPHVLHVLHSDLASRLMITEFCPNGTLGDRLGRFAGQPLLALRAFRGIVEAVAELHGGGVVHRDIKPLNIFVAADERLVLGDFGIVFVEDRDRSRLTESLERVGTRDWMPPWAHTGMRVDDVTPAFDVFSLGKVLWSMVSGRTLLPFWYWKRDANNLETIFPRGSAMALINQMLSVCVVEEESACLNDARELLSRVDEAIAALEAGGGIVEDGKILCRVCGLGRYRLRFTSEVDRVIPVLPASKEGLTNAQTVARLGGKNAMTVRVAACDRCGNVELFHFPDGLALPAWKVRSAWDES